MQICDSASASGRPQSARISDSLLLYIMKLGRTYTVHLLSLTHNNIQDYTLNLKFYCILIPTMLDWRSRVRYEVIYSMQETAVYRLIG